MDHRNSYIPALRFHRLTGLYDSIIRLTARESVVKHAVIESAYLEGARSVLDLGCGTGTLAIMAAAAHPHVRIVGVDADLQALTIACAKVDEVSIPIEFRQGDAAALPFPDGEFERIISSFFFHHLTTESKHQVLRECRRVLQPGGYLLIADWTKPATPCAWVMFSLVRVLDGWGATEANAKGRLPELCREAGFRETVEVRKFSTMFGTLSLIRAQ